MLLWQHILLFQNFNVNVNKSSNNNINVNNNNNNNNNDNNNNNLPKNRKHYPAGESLISKDKGSSSVLVGNPSKDGGSIKIIVWKHFRLTPLFMSELCLLNR